MTEKLFNDITDICIIFLIVVSSVMFFDIQPHSNNLFDFGIKILVVSSIYVVIQRQILNVIEGELL